MRKALVIVALALAVAFLVAPGAAQAAGPTNTVILAAGASFPDALAGGILSQAYGAPILLTRKDSMPSETVAEIERRGDPAVIILGGEAVVSPKVVAALGALGVTDIERIGGKDRYETAALIAERADAAFLETGMAGVLDLAPYVTVEPRIVGGLTGPHVFFTGANVHVRAGSSGTYASNGRGNLILGYNEMRESTETQRTGSHSLVVGAGHRWTHGGLLLAGRENNGFGMAGSVSGGQGNTVAGTYSSVSAGRNNTASGSSSSVSGGNSNTASGYAGSVSGGFDNTASGNYSSVSGGEERSVTGAHNWRAGGYFQEK